MDVNGKQVVVLGLGISGMEAAKLLKDKGARVTVRDSASNNATVNQRADVLRQHAESASSWARPFRRRTVSIFAC